MPSGPALLARRFPALGLAHASLGAFPSGCIRARRLSEAAKREVWVKRDDRCSGVFGGGKVRKLEYLLAEAKRAGRSRVITFGGAGSNQCLATALFAPRVGLQAVISLAAQPPSAEVARALRALAATQAQIMFTAGVAQAEAAALRAERAQPTAPATLPAGGTNPMGNLAFVAAALELEAQVAAGLLPEPAFVVLPAGTLGSAVGLALGFALGRLRTRVLAVRASSVAYSNEDRARALFEETVAFARARDASFPPARFDAARLLLEHRELGEGYGRATEAARSAQKQARELEGFALEATYGAKAMAGLLRRDSYATRGPVLFWMTQNSAALTESEQPERRLPKEVHGYLT